ncbi:hypothetical protein AAFF_G00078950 [Aldrovandia affinis]|uniref:Uncharacterized protein n=1 Tax=Aldrovandia affinis TaxID=143900 RepID=A0AAD7RXI0_9TELE|nr:hypothetical protein AAFF_G00078950 [Aldrovandia affinis]
MTHVPISQEEPLEGRALSPRPGGALEGGGTLSPLSRRAPCHTAASLPCTGSQGADHLHQVKTYGPPGGRGREEEQALLALSAVKRIRGEPGVGRSPGLLTRPGRGVRWETGAHPVRPAPTPPDHRRNNGSSIHPSSSDFSTHTQPWQEIP